MEFKDVLEKRRSVRSFEKKPLDRAMVQSLLESSVLAPSAINAQPWEFWVVLGQKRVDDLSDRAKNWLMEKVAHDPTAGAVQQRQHLGDPELSLLYHASALVLIAAKSYEAQADEDCCIAATTLMLAARDAGIGTCWIGSTRPWFNQAEIKKELGIPQDARVVAPIVMGYPKAWPEGHGRIAPVIHWLT